MRDATLVFVSWFIGLVMSLIGVFIGYSMVEQPRTGDVNRDGVVDLIDLSLVQKNWGK